MNGLTTRITTLLLVLPLCGATEAASAMAAPQATTEQSQSNTPAGEPERPPANAPSSTTTQSNDTQPLPDSPSASQSQTQNQNEQIQLGQEPRGTAAARAAKTHGGAASKPAGAAIAPAKQRRTRSLLIKLGIVAGAGAALGTVYALAKGSPSRPPGAR